MRTDTTPGSAGAVLLDYLAAQAERITAEELRVRRREPDSVHQLRIAARRLRSALQAYRRLLDRGQTDPLVDGLRTVGRRLAPARDAEVLKERICAGLATLEPELAMGPVSAQVTRHFARLEADARDDALAALDGADHEDLLLGIDTLLERPAFTERAARPAGKELPKHVARTARRMERAIAGAIETGEDASLHEARKAGKRLRYATEVARPVAGKPAKRFEKGLKAVHSALGEYQDTVVARAKLRELGATGENGFTFGVLYGADEARAKQVKEELPTLWTKAWKPKRRRWL
jgi:CHAD domain-containing protein